MMNDRIHSIMTTNVVTVHPDDAVEVVDDLLFRRHFHHLPVVNDEGTLVGIITSWDLFKHRKHLNGNSNNGDGVKVKDLMTTKMATLGPNELIGAAAMIFLRHLFHGLPIVDGDRKLLGIVTTHDILKYEFEREYPNDIFVRETHWLEV